MLSPIAAIDSSSPLSASKGHGLQAAKSNHKDDGQLKEKFDQFVGETFYGQMLKSMHKMAGKPAYFHGGHAEEAFQGQLDQVLSEKMSQASAGQFSGSMYELFTLQRG